MCSGGKITQKKKKKKKTERERQRDRDRDIRFESLLTIASCSLIYFIRGGVRIAAAEINVPSAEKPWLSKAFPSKLGNGSEYSLACLACCQEFRFPPRPDRTSAVEWVH